MKMVTLAASFAAFATPALAAPMPCGERQKIVDRLHAKYEEARVGYGIQAERGLVEIYASDKTGTWTILLSFPDGKSCVVAAGDAWENDLKGRIAMLPEA